MAKACVLSRALAGFGSLVLLAACGGGGGGGGSTTPATVSTATPAPAPAASASFSTTAYTCPSSATTFAAGRAAAGGEATRRAAARPARTIASSTTLLAVSYDRSTARSAASTIAAREAGAGARLAQTLDFPNAGTEVHVLSVAAGGLANASAALRAQSGVQRVDPVGKRHRSTVSQGYFPNDPYFDGFTAAQNAAAGNSAPSTFKVGPYEESAGVPGQWDMHVIGLENAFAYSQSGNGSGVAPVAGALGSSSVKIAVIDTGEDPNSPELATKLAYQRCFITNPNGAQSSSSFATDPDGHGTDVAGIAAAAMGNGTGFVGAGGNVVIYAYRVFPTPDATCANDTGQDDQCSVNTVDIAAAINDAVAQHVNVISMSLGGGVCDNTAPNGDNDRTEGLAVANAITNHIVVVAAAGNDGSSPVEAPACDTAVIAAGASALADGQANGTNSSASGEYVASYSDWSTPGAAYKSSSAWGIVAPGGDPSGAGDTDDLHWIEHIWTSTPFGGSSGPFAGACSADYPGLTGPIDCRTLIAGTSMSTPHVAGAAALLISSSGGASSPYQSSAAMKTLLCQTADDIGDPHEGCGRLNVYRAMATVVGDQHLP